MGKAGDMHAAFASLTPHFPIPLPEKRLFHRPLRRLLGHHLGAQASGVAGGGVSCGDRGSDGGEAEAQVVEPAESEEALWGGGGGGGQAHGMDRAAAEGEGEEGGERREDRAGLRDGNSEEGLGRAPLRELLQNEQVTTELRETMKFGMESELPMF